MALTCPAGSRTPGRIPPCAVGLFRRGRHGRSRLTLRLPEGQHREQEWLNLLTAACGPPAAAA